MNTVVDRIKLSKPFKYKFIQEFITSEKSPFGLVVLDINLKIKFGNHSILKLLKSSFHDIKEKNLFYFFNYCNANVSKHSTLLNKLKNHEIITHELCLKDSSKMFDVTFAGIADKNKKLTHLICLFTDITDKKKLLTKIKVQEAHLSALIKNAPISIIILDNNFKITHINNEFIRTFGYKINEVKGRPLSNLISPKGFENETKNLALRIIGGETLNVDTKRKTKNKELLDVNISASKIIINNKTESFIILIKDISIQKQVENELRKAKEAAEKADKLKTEFLAQVSHEIRTPVNLIVSSANLLKEILEDNVADEVKELFGIINSGGTRIVRTIDLILNMAELETESFKPIIREIDINNEVLKQIVTDLSLLARSKKLELNYECKIKNPFVMGDYYSINQIFYNLIHNAIKYTDAGRVFIKAYKTPKKKLAIKIIDTGIGIGTDFKKNLFQPFAQESTGYTRKFEGTGLGLALVKKYCDYNSAEIKLKSKKGNGTTFTVIFN